MPGINPKRFAEIKSKLYEERARRRAAWSPPEPRYTGGVLAKYAALVSSASDGAVTTGARMTSNLRQRPG